MIDQMSPPDIDSATDFRTIGPCPCGGVGTSHVTPDGACSVPACPCVVDVVCTAPLADGPRLSPAGHDGDHLVR